ncbi:hypothetical protein [Crossiella sp. CA198]|uniref:hypothetical protein n=1 Tax=Crossiella sp. CA198 TaxID=3455607 RepID=UPI003F8D54F9
MPSSDLLLAKRFGDDRPGLDLLGVEKAAVPVTVVAADILAQEIKSLPLLDEFVLRLVKADVGGVAEIAAFLGLDRRLVDIAVADQHRNGDLLVGPGAEWLKLTDRGRRLADDLESITPVRKNVKIVFDRVTWSVADYENRDLITKAAAQAEGCVLLSALHTTRIKTTDITPAAVNSILKSSGRRASLDVLDITAVTPSTHRYMPAEILIYGDADRGEVETAVVVDGDHSEPHDAALSRLGGDVKLAFTVEPVQAHVPLTPALEAERVYPAPGGPLNENGPRVRGIRHFEHQLVLMSALETAINRILIATDMATRSVVDGTFIARLEQRLRARVQVDLILSRPSKDIDEELDRLARRHRGLRVHRPDSGDLNTLIFDGFWVASDFPWLSFRGAGRPFRDCSGTVLAIPEEVDREHAALLSRYAR